MVSNVSLKPQLPDIDDLKDFLETPLPESLKDLNLDKELAQHYGRVKQYLEDIKYDDEIPANQVAQIFNTLTQVLAHIIKLQESVQNIKRMDAVESALVDAMQTCPDDIKDAFFSEYDQIISRFERR